MYDDVAGTATVVFNEDLFTSGDESIDSFIVLPNGHFVLSTGGNATLGGLTFEDGDAVDYDPVSNTATLLFSESLFLTGASLDGFQPLANGNFLISTMDDETLGGLVFEDGDIIEYDPINDVATVFLDEDATFTDNADIGGFHVLDDGRIALSTLGSETFLISGLSFDNGDIVLLDPSNGNAILLFDEAAFGADQDVDAVFIQSLIPEPSSASLLALGLAGLARRRRALRRPR